MQALRLVGRVGSVEQWWGLYTHLARPSELPPLSDLHLFKLGIKPMWEDPANVNGGKWVGVMMFLLFICALCMLRVNLQFSYIIINKILSVHLLFGVFINIHLR